MEIQFRYREVEIHRDLEDFPFSFILGQAHKRYVLEYQTNTVIAGQHVNVPWSAIRQIEGIKKPTE